MQHPTSSNTLYVRAALRPFARHMTGLGGVLPFLRAHFDFEEIFVPHFFSPRPFWRAKAPTQRRTNSGALGPAIAKLRGAVLSMHPTHAFVGVGARVGAELARHDHAASCFQPVEALARNGDFSMLLLACLDTSPGFSTAHAAQAGLGLSQRHLMRHVLRWDLRDGSGGSRRAAEFPGCSASLGKFYPLYERDGNLLRGEIDGQPYLFVPSAYRALLTEIEVLRQAPRFIDCGRWNCLSCRIRSY